MKKQTDVIEDVTPKLATEYLQRNKTNRPIRQAHIDGFALDMKRGHWILNHQGIAFDENDIVAEEIQQMKHTNLGIEYFCNRQKSNVAKVIEMVTL